jgi:hypothetical protein|tara:strand:+ start:2639 stop:3079 length:441 start_codon:yes stop_codon:yes gene_type:complete
MNIAKTKALKEIVSKILGVDPIMLVSKDRRTEFIQARAICYCIMRQELGMSYSFIGKQFGKCHATVMHALENFRHEVKYDKAFNNNYSKALEVWKSDCQEYIEYDPKILKETVNSLVESNKLLTLELEELQTTIKNIKETLNVKDC